MNSIIENIENDNKNSVIYAPNEITDDAIEEGRRIAHSNEYQGYHSIEELRKALEV